VPTLQEVERGHKVRCYMRFPETAALWAGVGKADWHFFGDEVIVIGEQAGAPAEEA
jgi:hypothetical protein